jgi:hypothetical protein
VLDVRFYSLPLAIERTADNELGSTSIVCHLQTSVAHSQPVHSP